MKYTITTLILVLTIFSGFSQELGFDIFGNSGKSVSKKQLSEAKSLIDINPEYPSSWINESDYVSSEIKTSAHGEIAIARGMNEVLNAEQMNVLKEAEIGSNIDIEVKYNVHNSITNKVALKTMKFTVSLVPEKEAEYLGGQDEMKKYLKQRTVDKINSTSKSKFEMARVKFVVDENGNATSAQISQTSKDDNIDQILLETIDNMPNWRPAEDSNGVKVSQEFELVVGTMIGC